MVDARRERLISIGCAALVLAGAGLLAWSALASYNEYSERERRFLVAQAEADRALRNAQAELDLAEQVSGTYFALQGAGLFSGVNKPVAIDKAEAALKPWAAAVTRYQVGGGHETAPSPEERASRYQVDIQRVAIEFEPLHEERFLDVWKAISDLRGPVGGVENCEMHRPADVNVQERARQALAHDSGPPPLKARCLLTWYRLLEPVADAGAGAAAANAAAANAGAHL